jgi:hypothetical protein
VTKSTRKWYLYTWCERDTPTEVTKLSTSWHNFSNVFMNNVIWFRL